MRFFLNARLLVVLIFFCFSYSFCIAGESVNEKIHLEKILSEAEQKLKDWKLKTTQYYVGRHELIDKESERIYQVLADLKNDTYQGSIYKLIVNWRFYIDQLTENIIGEPPLNPFLENDFNDSDLLKNMGDNAELLERYKNFETLN